MSGGMCLAVAARPQPDWPIAKLVCCSGGGEAPDNDARKVINSYDGSLEHMRRIVEVMFVDRKWATDDTYIKRRHEMANMPGAWEATSAARFKAPFRGAGGPLRARPHRLCGDHGARAGVRRPARPAAQARLHRRVRAARSRGAKLHLFENAAHMGNIECADEFNARVLEFLRQD